MFWNKEKKKHLIDYIVKDAKRIGPKQEGIRIWIEHCPVCHEAHTYYHNEYDWIKIKDSYEGESVTMLFHCPTKNNTMYQGVIDV